MERGGDRGEREKGEKEKEGEWYSGRDEGAHASLSEEVIVAN